MVLLLKLQTSWHHKSDPDLAYLSTRTWFLTTLLLVHMHALTFTQGVYSTNKILQLDSESWA